MNIVSRYIIYIRNIRRYSERTARIYEEVLRNFVAYACDGDTSPSDRVSSIGDVQQLIVVVKEIPIFEFSFHHLTSIHASIGTTVVFFHIRL